MGVGSLGVLRLRSAQDDEIKGGWEKSKYGEVAFRQAQGRMTGPGGRLRLLRIFGLAPAIRIDRWTVNVDKLGGDIGAEASG